MQVRTHYSPRIFSMAAAMSGSTVTCRPRFGDVDTPVQPKAAAVTASKPFFKPEPDFELIAKAAGFAEDALKNTFKTDIDFPKHERAKFQRAIDSGKPLQLAMHHPEFTTDFLITLAQRKEFPKAAGWLFHGFFMPPVRGILSRLNMIPSAPTEDAMRYTEQYLKHGGQSGILPAGHVFWTSDKIPPFAPGVINIGWQTKGLILPAVWKYRFVEDATPGLMKDIDFFEEHLKIPNTQHMTKMDERFFAFQKNLLQYRLNALAEHLPPSLKQVAITNENFFEIQEKASLHLIELLEKKYGSNGNPQGVSIHQRVRRLEKALEKAAHKETGMARLLSMLGLSKNEDTALLTAARYLAESFSSEWYNSPTITQEHIAESLKRATNQELSKAQYRFWHIPKGYISQKISVPIPIPVGMFPIPAAKRQAIFRFAQPMDIQAKWNKNLKSKFPLDETAFKAKMMQDLRTAMQDKLDDINRKIPSFKQYANPFYTA